MTVERSLSLPSNGVAPPPYKLSRKSAAAGTACLLRRCALSERRLPPSALLEQLAGSGVDCGCWWRGTRDSAPPVQDLVELAVQLDGHSAGESGPALEFEFRNGDDERGLGLGGERDRFAEAASGGLQWPEAVDDDRVDAAHDQGLDPRSHVVQPLWV